MDTFIFNEYEISCLSDMQQEMLIPKTRENAKTKQNNKHSDTHTDMHLLHHPPNALEPYTP